LRVYLDNCCYNRPYDDQTQIRISLEAQSKLYIQDLIRQGKIELASSYMSNYECSKNPYIMRRETILSFMETYTKVYISEKSQDAVETAAKAIVETGVKFKDACHVAAAIYGTCDYFISTDDRLLKYQSDKIILLSPIANVNELTVMALLIPFFAIVLKRNPLKIISSRNPTNSMEKNPAHIESVGPR